MGRIPNRNSRTPDLRDHAVAPPSTIKRCTNTVAFQGMTVQAINGASREDLLRLSDTALRIWPE
jgi:hypothetical protein